MKNYQLTKEYLYKILFLAVGALMVVTRFWRLTTIPSGLHLDEAGMAYDAWCLANYGVDRYLNSWPLYLVNYGGGQSILYCYLCAGLFRLFGFSVWLVRLPAVVFSFLTWFFGMKLTRRLSGGNMPLTLFVGLLVAVCPYFILNSRFGLDCNLLIGMSCVFLYCFLCAIETDRIRWYVLSGAAGGLVLYTYVLSYLILPGFLVLALLYCIRVRRFRFTRWLSMAVPMGIIAAPLIAVQIINMFDLPELVIAGFTFTKLDFYRVGELGRFNISYLLQMLRSTFINGEFDYVSAPGYCNLYAVAIPLFVIGLIRAIVRFAHSLKSRELDSWSWILLWLIVVLLLFAHLKPIAYRLGGIYPAVALLTALGAETLIRLLSRHTPRLCTPVMLYGAFCVAYLLMFARFGNYYYRGGYTAENYPLTHFDIMVTDALNFLEEHPEYQNEGVYMAEPDIYYALSSLSAPFDLGLDPYASGHCFQDYYQCGTLPEIDTSYNYIVRDTFTEYAQELRSMGYTEISYPNYSLFYRE